MIHEKERTALNPSVAAEGEQPITNHNVSIADGAGNVNTQTVNSGKGEKNRLKTVSMTDLYNRVYAYISNVNGETYTVQATEDYADKYGDAVGAYVDYVTGAAILVKSTSADIALNDVEIQSSTGVALLTALNSDSMSRYLKRDVGSGVNVTVTDSTIDGDFIHDDYQRDMTVTLNNATLNGDITFSTADEWNEMWSAYADDETACWVNLDANAYITDTHATALTLSNGSVWNVKEASELTTLAVSADSTVNGSIEAETTETLDDGTVVYTHATVTAA